MSRNALGRGLSALIPNSSAAPSAQEGTGHGDGRPLRVPIDKIRPNHLQPRRHFDPEALSELSVSIKQHGLAQPIVVSFDSATKSYELIAGERRWRACQLAGHKEIDVVVRQPNDEKHRMALALIENLQRADLNPIEVALGYLRLMKEFGINQSELAQEMGKSKSTISNTLRLLELTEDMQKAVQFGHLSEGHGRALLMISDPHARHGAFLKITEEHLSVREAEALAKQLESGELSEASKEKTASTSRPARPADLVAIEESIQSALGTKVEIRSKKNPAKGSITLHYFSFEDFDRLIKILKK